MASIFDRKKARGVKYQKKILLGTGNKNLHETSNDSGVKIVIFAKFCIFFYLFRT
jgi:hypothetical protein